MQILNILFGWVLGLLSPAIVEVVKNHFHKREFVAALKVELEDLRMRLAMSSMSLVQSNGMLDDDFASWMLGTIRSDSGNEPSDGVRKFLEQFVTMDGHLKNQIVEHGRMKVGEGPSLKTFQAKFLESNLVEVSKLPIAIQRKIHELRNQLNILNQDIAQSQTLSEMTTRH